MSKRFTLSILLGLSLTTSLFPDFSRAETAGTDNQPRSAANFLTLEADLAEIPLGDHHGVKNFKESPAGKVYWSHREATYRMPRTYHDAVLYSDAPIDMIQDLHNRSYDYWSSKSNVTKITENLRSNVDQYHQQRSQGDDGPSFNIDVLTLADLNTQAYKIWNQLVDCNNGSYSVARQNFMRPAEGVLKLCDKEIVGTDLSQKNLVDLKRLAKNIQKFYGSIDLGWTKTIKHSSFAEIYRQVFRNLHPIISQILILQYSSMAFDHREGDIPRVITSANIQIGMFLHELDQDGLGLNKLSIASNLGSAESKERRMMVGLIVNATGILSFLNYENFEYACGVYGLWPLLNRTLLYQEFPVMDDFASPVFPMLKESVQRNCGITPIFDFSNGLLTNSHGPFYSRVWPLHRLYTQGLFYNILGTQWDTRSEFDISMDAKKEELRPTVEAIGDGVCTILQFIPVVGQLIQLSDPWGMKGSRACFH